MPSILCLILEVASQFQLQCGRGEWSWADRPGPCPAAEDGELPLVETWWSPHHHPLLLYPHRYPPLRQCRLWPDHQGRPYNQIYRLRCKVNLENTQEINCEENDVACMETLCPYGWTYVQETEECQLKEGDSFLSVKIWFYWTSV